MGGEEEQSVGMRGEGATWWEKCDPVLGDDLGMLELIEMLSRPKTWVGPMLNLLQSRKVAWWRGWWRGWKQALGVFPWLLVAGLGQAAAVADLFQNQVLAQH